MTAALSFRVPAEARPEAPRDVALELRASLAHAFTCIQRGELPDDAWMERTAFLLARTDHLKGM